MIGITIDTYRAMGVSSFIVFQKTGQVLSVAVFDCNIEAPLFAFSLNETAFTNLMNLVDGENNLIIPGTNIKEIAAYQQTGELPAWTGKL